MLSIWGGGRRKVLPVCLVPAGNSASIDMIKECTQSAGSQMWGGVPQSFVGTEPDTTKTLVYSGLLWDTLLGSLLEDGYEFQMGRGILGLFPPSSTL